MRLPTGEIEVVSGDALERARRCGLADARTPVRAVGSPVWTTLAEVADMETSDEHSLGSLLPVAVDEPAPDLARRSIWAIRTEVDVRTLRERASGWTRLFVGVALMASVAIGAIATSKDDARARAAAAGASRGGSSAAEAALLARRPTHDAKEMLRVEPPGDRFTREQRKKLREMDYVHRLMGVGTPKGPKRFGTSRTPLAPERKGASDKKEAPSASPFVHGGDPHDPLNGRL